MNMMFLLLFSKIHPLILFFSRGPWKKIKSRVNKINQSVATVFRCVHSPPLISMMAYSCSNSWLEFNIVLKRAVGVVMQGAFKSIKKIDNQNKFYKDCFITQRPCWSSLTLCRISHISKTGCTFKKLYENLKQSYTYHSGIKMILFQRFIKQSCCCRYCHARGRF